MIYFISYDITSSKRRHEVSKILENFGLRIQYSFFQCELEKDRLDDLKYKLLNAIEKDEDSLLICPMCQECLSLTQTLGTGSIFIPTRYEIL